MEEFKKIFNKFYNRLIIEGLIKAAILANIIGFALAVLVAFILFFVSFNAIWISVLCYIGTFIISLLVLYFVKYKPSTKDVARRVDMEGLEERLITMVELEGNESYIAKKQREDAIEHAKKVSNTKLKLKFSKSLSITTIVVAIVGILIITLIGCSLGGFLPSYTDIVIDTQLQDITLNYSESNGGIILGNKQQTIKEGENATEVCAVANSGFMFSIWSDGVTTPNRLDKDVKESKNVVAIFIPIVEEQDGGFIEDKNAPEANDDMQNMEGNMPNGVHGSAGKYEEPNQIIDGETYYRDVLEDYYEQVESILNSGGIVPDYLRKIIEDYYEVIK